MNFSIVAALILAQIVGSEFPYTVRAGDSLTKIGARFGVSPAGLAAANGLDLSTRLVVGRSLTVDNRHILPPIEGALIVVNVPQRMLFWMPSDGPVQGFPVAAGRRGWKTPLGDFTVATMETDPTWDVPLSIQEEMRREGKPVLKRVPPSPQNPLGRYWIGLSAPNIGIHGTNAPSSIYSLVTHGCMRLHPDDVEQLFPQVEIGMSVRIVYDPVLMTREGDAVFLEVHPDTYAMATDARKAIMERARLEGYLELLDQALVEEAFRKRDGVVRNVTRR